MGFIKKNLLKVIECSDFNGNTLVHKFVCPDRYEIMKGSKLIVRPSQAAIFIHKGQICDIFTEGQYSLDTSNLPILSKIASIIYAFEMPNLTDIYFLNMVQFTGIKWGTTAPLSLRDKDFGIVRIMGHGEFAFRIASPEKFMREYFGTLRACTSDQIQDYLKAIVLQELSDALGEAGIPVLDLPANYRELAELTKTKVADKFDKLGLEVTEMLIKNFKLPEAVEQVIDKRTSVGVMSDKMSEYAAYESVGAMRDAAKNPGSGGMFAGLGVGLGAGRAVGSTFASSFATASTKPKIKCSKCGTLLDEGTNFCSNCGSKVVVSTGATTTCAKCHATIPDSAKFCPNCGAPTKLICSNCGKELPAGTKFCPDCGTKMP